MYRKALVAGILLAAVAGWGCGNNDKDKKVAKIEVKGPALQAPAMVYTSKGQVFRYRSNETPEFLADGSAWFPALNPKGTMVAYWEDESAFMSLYMIDVASKQTTKVGRWNTLGSNGRNLNLRNSPCWHPTQDACFFADGRQIWQVSSDGTNLQTIYEHQGGECYSVAVSPDGKNIAFIGITEKDQNLWIFSTVSKEARKVTDFTINMGLIGGVSWSPLGNQIAFVLYKAEESNVVLMPAEGGPTVQLTKSGNVNSPSWDVTGRKLAVCTGSQNAYIWQVALMNASDGKLITQLTTEPHGAYSPNISGAW